MHILFLTDEYSQQRQHEKPAHIYPIRLAMYATYLRNLGHIVNWNPISLYEASYFDTIIENENQIEIPFLKLPAPDRILTKAMDYAYDNGNFKYTPGTYISVANSCWYGGCTFCVENKVRHYEVRTVRSAIDEILECRKLGYREVFDDSGTFPIGRWLHEFCKNIRDIDIRWSCNMRLCDIDYSELRKSGCRMLLFGVESANQKTLDKIKKGVKVEDIKYIKKAAEAGLEPHIAVMFGYPWETDEDAINTLHLVHDLLRKGYAQTAQASFYSPQGIADGPVSHKKYVGKIYEAAYSLQFWVNKIKMIRNVDDLKYLWRGIKKGMART